MTVGGSLTPAHRSDEAISAANYEGMFNGIATLIPTAAAVALALRNPSFVRRTNWQSRTAIVIMPAMFVAALTGEHKLSHRMREMAVETQHSAETVQWAEQQWKEQSALNALNSNMTESQHLAALYRESVTAAGVCIVPQLYWYHKAANFTAQNPFKVLTAIAVPTVGYIFYGRSEQSHLQLSSKIMHTRVFGQFATISMLLGVMGFKEFMDRNGRFISQEQADNRVLEMELVRAELHRKLEEERKHAADLKEALAEAHQQDVHDHNVSVIKKKIEKKRVHDDHHSELVIDSTLVSKKVNTVYSTESLDLAHEISYD